MATLNKPGPVLDTDGTGLRTRHAANTMAATAVRSQLTALVLALIITVCVLTATTTGFLTRYNVDSLEATVAVAVVVAFAQAIALSIGQFNLALGAIGGTSGMFLGWLMQVHHFDSPLAVALACLLGASLGAVQGLMITLTQINPFVISLGLASVYGGTLLGLTESNSYTALATSFVNAGQHDFLGVRMLVFPALAVAIAVAIVLGYTVTGRRLLAVGANVRAAGLSGIHVNRTIVVAHILSGLLGSIAGVMLVAQLGSAQPYGGDSWLLASFAAPVLGGTLLAGGRVSVLGAIVGAVFLCVIDNALILLGINPYWYQAFLGLLILGAIGLERGRLSFLERWRPAR